MKKKFRVETTDSNHVSPITDRLLRVEDHSTLPADAGEVLERDITYLMIGGHFLYLAVVSDIYT